jgi:8-oxo-dGTP pyrophosphatase MutT (NUDIX family)
MYPIRVSAKALVYRDNKVLASYYKKGEREWFVIPGGGVNREETAIEGVVREVREETGYIIQVEKMVFVREFIPSRLGHNVFTEGFHQLELYFVCSLLTAKPLEPTEHDINQVGCQWLPLELLHDYHIYPESLKENIRTRHFPERYVGNVL